MLGELQNLKMTLILHYLIMGNMNILLIKKE